MRFKSGPMLSLFLALLLTGCASGGKTENNLTSIAKKLPKVEACREAFRLAGKASDEFTKNLGSLKFNFNELSKEFETLSSETEDQNLSTSLKLISNSLLKMSKESTFFEGNAMYLNELPLLTKECA